MNNFSTIIYLLFFISYIWSHFVHSINEAPAKVVIRVKVSKLSQDWINESFMKLCVDKSQERCYWSLNKLISWDGEQYKDFEYVFFISNMATQLTLKVTLEQSMKKINYPQKIVNLRNYVSKTNFELHSFNLESYLTVTIEHECENGYYPPKQCTKACFKMPNESDCDNSGNKICKNGLQYDSRLDRCVTNNCVKSKISCVNGKCVNKGETLECVCFENFYGESCQHRNLCHPNPCQNNGDCKVDVNRQSYNCSCLFQYTGERCQYKISLPNEKCNCPKNTKCTFTETGDLKSCISEIDKNKSEIIIVTSNDFVNNDNPNIRELKSKSNSDWRHISITTIIVATVGCLMLILCVCISIYVCYYSRDPKNVKRESQLCNAQSALYSDYPVKGVESSFKRSFSLDNNSAYVPVNSQVLQTLPNDFTLSSMGYSNKINTYQEYPLSSLGYFPMLDGSVYQPEQVPLSPLIMHQRYIKDSSFSTTSGDTASTPPTLPARTRTDELSPFGTLPKPE